MSDKIYIFDTTLRDGEQSAGVSFTPDEKLEIARQLERLGVDVIEAGFPATSPGDLKAVQDIAAAIQDCTICGLARAVRRDIESAWEGVKGAKSPRIHVFINSSDIQMAHQLQKAKEQVLEQAAAMVAHARNLCDNIEFSPMDATRSDQEFLYQIIERCIEAGATTINVPDSVGYAIPQELAQIFQGILNNVPNLDKARLSFHGQNDLGLCTANTLTAIQNGVRQVEVTINGIGERAGNAALEEIVMAMRTRTDYYDKFSTNIDISKLYPSSRMVSTLTGLQVQRNKALVGQNAFAHESGIHQDGMLKNRNTYEIMDPQTIGVPESKLVLGKHSGRHALGDRIKQLGYKIDDDTLNRVYESFKALADKKKDVFDEDIEAMIDTTLESASPMWQLVSFQVSSGSGVAPSATVTMRDATGEQREHTETGDGPLDAIFSAVQQLTGVTVKLEDYSTRAVTGGKDAQGEATVQVNHHGRQVRGRGVSTDVIEAAANAYVAAINRIKTAEARQVAATTMGDGSDDEGSVDPDAKAESP